MATTIRTVGRTCDDWRRLLYAAEDRLAALMLGNTTRVRDGDRELQTETNPGDLQRAIEFYRRKVEACDGVSSTGRHAIRVTPV
jgi:hypothetical protein